MGHRQRHLAGAPRILYTVITLLSCSVLTAFSQSSRLGQSMVVRVLQDYYKNRNSLVPEQADLLVRGIQDSAPTVVGHVARFCEGDRTSIDTALELRKELERMMQTYVEPSFPDAFLAGGELEGLEDLIPALCPMLSATLDVEYGDLQKEVVKAYVAALLQRTNGEPALAAPLLAKLAEKWDHGEEWDSTDIDLCFDQDRDPAEVVADLNSDLAAWALQETGVEGSLPVEIRYMESRLLSVCAGLNEVPVVVTDGPFYPWGSGSGTPPDGSRDLLDGDDEDPELDEQEQPWLKPIGCDLGALTAACAFSGTLVEAMAEGTLPQDLWRYIFLENPDSVENVCGSGACGEQMAICWEAESPFVEDISEFCGCRAALPTPGCQRGLADAMQVLNLLEQDSRGISLDPSVDGAELAAKVSADGGVCPAASGVGTCAQEIMISGGQDQPCEMFVEAVPTACCYAEMLADGGDCTVLLSEGATEAMASEAMAPAMEMEVLSRSVSEGLVTAEEAAQQLSDKYGVETAGQLMTISLEPSCELSALASECMPKLQCMVGLGGQEPFRRRSRRLLQTAEDGAPPVNGPIRLNDTFASEWLPFPAAILDSTDGGEGAPPIRFNSTGGGEGAPPIILNSTDGGGGALLIRFNSTEGGEGAPPILLNDTATDEGLGGMLPEDFLETCSELSCLQETIDTCMPLSVEEMLSMGMGAGIGMGMRHRRRSLLQQVEQMMGDDSGMLGSLLTAALGGPGSDSTDTSQPDDTILKLISGVCSVECTAALQTCSAPGITDSFATMQAFCSFMPQESVNGTAPNPAIAAVLKEFVRLKLEADESMDDMTQDVVLEGAEELGAEWSVLVGRSCANKASANATAAVMRMRLEEIASELSSTLDAPVVLGGQELEGVEEVLPALCPFLNTTNTTANMTKTVSEVISAYVEAAVSSRSSESNAGNPPASDTVAAVQAAFESNGGNLTKRVLHYCKEDSRGPATGPAAEILGPTGADDTAAMTSLASVLPALCPGFVIAARNTIEAPGSSDPNAWTPASPDCDMETLVEECQFNSTLVSAIEHGELSAGVWPLVTTEPGALTKFCTSSACVSAAQSCLGDEIVYKQTEFCDCMSHLPEPCRDPMAYTGHLHSYDTAARLGFVWDGLAPGVLSAADSFCPDTTRRDTAGMGECYALAIVERKECLQVVANGCCYAGVLGAGDERCAEVAASGNLTLHYHVQAEEARNITRRVLERELQPEDAAVQLQSLKVGNLKGRTPVTLGELVMLTSPLQDDALACEAAQVAGVCADALECHNDVWDSSLGTSMQDALAGEASLECSNVTCRAATLDACMPLPLVELLSLLAGLDGNELALEDLPTYLLVSLLLEQGAEDLVADGEFGGEGAPESQDMQEAIRIVFEEGVCSDGCMVALSRCPVGDLTDTVSKMTEHCGVLDRTATSAPADKDHPNHVAEDEPIHVVLARVALPLDEPQEEVDTGIESKYVSWMASAANVPEDQVTIVDTGPGAVRSTVAFPKDNSEAIEAFEGYMGSSELRETGSAVFGGEVDGEIVGSVDLQSSRELQDILEEDNAWDLLLEESEKQNSEGPVPDLTETADKDHPNHVTEDEPVHVVLARVALTLDEPQEEVDTGIASKYVSWMASAANVPEDQVTIVDTAPGAVHSTIAFPQDNSEAIEAFEGYMGSSDFRKTGSAKFGGEVDGEIVGSVDLQSSRELQDILEEDNAWDLLLEESEKQNSEGPVPDLTETADKDHPNHVTEDEPVHVVLARVALPLDEPQEEVDTGIESKYVSWMASAANVPEDQVTIVDTAPGAIRSTIAFPQDNSEAIEAFEGYMGSSEFRETGSTEFGGEVDGEIVGSVDLQSSRELGDILDEENAWNVLLEESEKQSNKGPDQPRGVEDEPVHVVLARVALPLDEPQEDLDAGIASKYVSWMASAANVPEDQVTIVDTAPGSGAVRSTISFPQDNSEAIEAFEGYMGSSEFHEEGSAVFGDDVDGEIVGSVDLQSSRELGDILEEDNAWDLLLEESEKHIYGIDRKVFIAMVSLCGILLCLCLCNLFFWLWYCCSQYGPVKSKDPFQDM